MRLAPSRLVRGLISPNNTQADEVEFYKEEASKCVMRAQAGKKNKDALQGEQGSLQAQLSHQVRVAETTARRGTAKGRLVVLRVRFVLA